MRLWGVLVGALLTLGCAGKTYSPSEGPPRLTVRAPRAADVEAVWTAVLLLEGREVIGTACLIVDAQDAPLLASCFDLYTRQIRVSLRFPRSLYMEMARQNPFGIMQPGDTLERVPEGPLTTPLFDEWGWDGDIHVRFSLWHAEPGDDGMLSPKGLIAAKTIPVRLSCLNCIV